MTARCNSNARLVRVVGVLALITAGCNDSSDGPDGESKESVGEGTDGGGQSSDGPDDGVDDGDGDDGSDGGGTTDGGSEEPWEPGGPSGECAVDELVPAHVYVRRVKTLLTGEAPSDDEVAAVLADEDALAGLIEGWVETEAFGDKLHEYFRVTLQQASLGRLEYVSQIGNNDSAGQFRPPDALFDNLNDSFVRTATKLVQDGRPFNEIASSRTWMMTTAMMSYLVASDQRAWGTATYYSAAMTQDGVTFNASTPMATQIANQTFYIADAPAGCTPETSGNVPRLYSRATGEPVGPNDCEMSIQGLFNAGDFDDWREVTIEALGDGDDLVRFYDAPTLRAADTIALRSAKAGFFSSPAFLAGWRTNEDNSFRVTTNQTLIVALGLAFEDSDVTTPLGDEGLSKGHAEPGTECYGCHKNLDPMRNFFDNIYYPDTYSVLAPEDMPQSEASFSFQGHSSGGQDLADFGQIVAEHPVFASGWTQKLCYLANSQACDTNDPEFARVAQVFEDSNFDFKTLVIELFSSPLVTGAQCPETVPMTTVPTSGTRREHLCAALNQRLGIDACDVNNNARDLSDALPADSWSRGSYVPNQPAQSSLFYAATTDSLCRTIADVVVNATDSPLQSDDMEGSLDVLVEQVMGLAPADPRHDDMRGLLGGHVLDAAEITNNARNQLESAFVLACTSPYVTSTDL